MTQAIRRHPVRAFFDGIYYAASILAALCLVAILLVIVAQMVTRWLGIPFPGGAQYAGYLMAASTFLAFASALNSGTHIRVGLIFLALGKHRNIGEFWCLLIGAAASSYLAWYAVKMVYWSHKLHDVSQGQDMTPLWYAQLPLMIGAILLAVCFVDNLVTLLLTGKDNIREDTSEQTYAE